MPPRFPAHRALALAVARQYTTAAPGGGIISSILHGSPEAKKEGDVTTAQHSKAVGRNKYIHELQTHHVIPSKVDEYKKAAADYYTALASDPSNHVKLTGSWETIIGRQDSFFHILEYDGFAGYDATTAHLQNSELRANFNSRILPLLRHRTNELSQEFAFFPSATPHATGGVFERRRYALKPGTLLEWENLWRQGIEARRKFITPAGAYFSQVGELHKVTHLWQHPSLEQRKTTREKAWTVDGWAETVSQTVKLCDSMEASIMEPLPYSPLK